MILLIAIPVSIASSVFLPTDEEDLAQGFANVLTFYYGVDDNQFIYSVGTQIGTILFAIFLIRRWSKQWNMQYEH